MLKFLTVLIITITISSCIGNARKEGKMKAPDSLVSLITEKSIPSVLPARPDSFDIVYYKKPFTDSTRYSRFYKVAHSGDSVIVNELNSIFLGGYTKLIELKKCLSEGKIIFPLGGDAYRTIYFSRLGTGCPYLYYIKDGAFYYYEITPALDARLSELESKAVAPK
ncbi:MAG TPA: hypothetical protein VK166_13875 [Chitinophagaceae bacterium]|nr:hypothetical protein [Chitinophagaceae bacterium]